MAGFDPKPKTPVNYKNVIPQDAGEGRPRRQKERPMDPLKISSVEFDDRDPFRATFNVHLSRDMTDFERQTLPPLLSSGRCAVRTPWCCSPRPRRRSSWSPVGNGAAGDDSVGDVSY